LKAVRVRWGLTPLPKRRWTIDSSPTNAPERMKRILLVSTTKVSPFPPDAPPLPPPKPGRPSLTPFFPPAPLKLRFIGLLGSQLGGSYPPEVPPVSAFGPAPVPLPLGVEEGECGVDGVEEEGEEELEDIGGGLADKVTFVPSSKRSKACWTPSPPTSLPPPHAPSLPPRLASLSISSIWMIPILVFSLNTLPQRS
jgi:hypothetical protein